MIARTIMVCAAFIAVLVGYSVYDHMRWQEFDELHECAATSKVAGYHIMQPTYNVSNGTWSTSPVYYPGHTVYKCNDGKEYAR